MFKFLIFAVLAVALVVIVFMVVRSKRTPERKVNSAERKELYELRNLVYRLDDLAYAHRELDSILAPQVIDEIRKTRKELE